MSTSRKGNDLEKRVVEILRSQGWKAEQSGKKTKRIPPSEGRPARTIAVRNDMFGAFDVHAIKRGEPVRYIQVSTKTQGWDKRQQVAHVLPDLPLEHCDAEIWLFVGGRRESGGQRFRVQRWNGTEWGKCEDQVCIPAEKKAKRAA